MAPRRRLGAAILAYVLVYLAWLLLYGGPGRELIGDLAFVPLTWFAAFLCLRAGRRAAAVPGMLWAWRLLALALISYGIGDALQCVYELATPAYPSPSVADVFFLAFYPLFLAGILRFPWRGEAGRAARTQATLDAATIAICGGTVIWFVVLGPTAYADSGSLVSNMVAVSYPAGDLILITALARLWMGAGDERIRTSLRLIAFGIGAYVIADVAYSLAILHSEYSGGSWIDSLWMVAAALFAFAAIAQPSLDPDVEAVPGRDRRRFSVAAAALPYVGVAAVFALLLDAHHNDPFFPNLSLAVTATGVAGLLLFREYLSRRSLAQAQEKLAALATTDPLTGLPNHRALAETIDRELGRARRFGRDFSLLFVDIDRFKSLNDSAGHAAGDAVLGELATVMRDSVRGLDTIGRWGGEEFVAVLPEVGPVEGIEAAERLRAAVASHPFAEAGSLRITTSVGVASYPRDGASRLTLLEAADRAMYSAKHLGRNQVCSAADPVVGALPASEQPATEAEEALASDAVDALTTLVDDRDAGTGRHTARVAALAAGVAEAMGCPPAQAQDVRTAARLHDIGKVAIADSILRKPGRLSPREWELMRQHPTIGAEVVSRVGRLAELAPVIRSHHERYDGSGYPEGLAGDEIPLEARIISAVDAFDAMTSERPYRDALTPEDARRELREGAGSQFDPEVVAAVEGLLDRRAEAAEREVRCWYDLGST